MLTFLRVCQVSESEVCGYDGVTYKSECFAEEAGTGVDYYGPCLPKKYEGTLPALLNIIWEKKNQRFCRKVR